MYTKTLRGPKGNRVTLPPPTSRPASACRSADRHLGKLAWGSNLALVFEAVQEQINCFKYEHQRVHRSVPQWSYFQTSSNKPLKLCLICMSGLLLLYSHLTREPTTSPVLTKWWNWELMLATNFDSLSQTVTKGGSQNFGYQFWFCTRLLRIFFIVACRTKLASWRWWMILASSSRTSEIPLSPVMTLGCVNLSSI